MSSAERWLRYPQSVGLRKALFQVHLWAGLILAIYVLVMSVTGTILIYRRELSRVLTTQPPHIAIGSGPRMTSDEIKQAALRAHPGFDVARIFQPRRPDQPAEVWLERGHKKMQRLMNPYSGADLGNSLDFGFRAVLWLVDLHDNLLAGRTGHVLNGVGGACVTLLCLSGLVVWWPGIERWRRSLAIDWRARGHRLNWSLHSALGFWSLLFILTWGVSGVYLGWPAPFNGVVDYLEPAQSRDLRFGDVVLSWLAKLHFGRFPSLTLKLVWTLFGLIPVILLITGAMMWWNRVVGPRLRGRSAAKIHLPRERPRAEAERAVVYNLRNS